MERKPLRKCDIRRIVLERLDGFRHRQLERDTIRANRRKTKWNMGMGAEQKVNTPTLFDLEEPEEGEEVISEELPPER